MCIRDRSTTTHIVSEISSSWWTILFSPVAFSSTTPAPPVELLRCFQRTFFSCWPLISLMMSFTLSIASAANRSKSFGACKPTNPYTPLFFWSLLRCCWWWYSREEEEDEEEEDEEEQNGKELNERDRQQRRWRHLFMFPSSSCSNIRAASLFFVFAAFQRLLFDSFNSRYWQRYARLFHSLQIWAILTEKIYVLCSKHQTNLNACGVLLD